VAQWTDIEQLQRKKKRRQQGKNFLAVLLAALVVAGILYLRNSEEFQEFLDTTILGTGYQEGDGYPVEFVGVDTVSTQIVTGNQVAVLNSSKLTILNSSGGVQQELSHQMMNPRVVFGGERTLLYDFSGKTWALYSGDRLLEQKTLEHPIYGADLSASGAFAVASGSEQNLSVVTGYTREQNVCFEWKSTGKIVTDLVIDETGREVAFTTVSAKKGKLITNLYVYRFDREEPVTSLEFEDEIALSLQYRYNGSLTLLTDKALSVINGAGKLAGHADFGGELVSAFADTMDRFTVVVLGDYSDTKSCQVVYYDMKGEEDLRFTMNYPVKQIKSTADALYIYNETGLHQYGETGNERGALYALNIIDFAPYDSGVYYMTFDGLEKGSMGRVG